MKRSVSVMLLPQLSYAAAMHMALMLFAFKDAPVADHLGLFIWWVFLLIEYVAMHLFLRQSRELRSVVLVSGAVLLCQLAVTIFVNPVYPTLMWWAAAVFMWGATYYQCVSAFLQGVKPETLMVNFEVAALSLFAAAVMIGGGAVDSGVLPHLAAGLLCSLAALMGVRTMHTRMDSSDERPMVRMLPGLLLLGIGACVVLFCLLVGGQAAELLGIVAAWLGRTIKAIVQGIGAFLFWLFSLLPEPKDNVDSSAFEGPSLPGGAVEGVTESNPILLYVLIFASVTALLVVLVRLWRKVRVTDRTRVVTAARTVVVRKNPLWEVFLKFFRKIVGRVRYELTYLRRKNTAAGLLVWLERNIRRGKGETSAAYLRRVAERIPDCAENLRTLSKCLDKLYYGGGDELAADTVKEMRRAFQRALRDSVKS